MANRLANSTSPYLRQHAGNPVDWFEWGPEAFERARSSGRPILLSIGYAACHWCHVMAHESFEDPATAAMMNERFVSIKVDREERPDIDAIYMQAVQALTGQGGWPMTVFLTPDGVPFHGGTYFPPQDRHGLPSFQRVLGAVANAWRDRPAEVEAAGQALTEHLRRATAVPDAAEEVNRQTLEYGVRSLSQAFDARHGGFGGAPKFPPTMALDFLLRFHARTGDRAALDMVLRTHRGMREGGIYDQLGGGLHRYSVDERWLVPHFEKMLYDNALFARLGVHLWQVTRDPDVLRVTRQTLDWAVHEMRDPGGGFHSSLDADSDGEEGRFYVWDHDEFMRVAAGDAEVAAAHWGVSADGNWEGHNILSVPDGLPATVARTGRDAPAVMASLDHARSRLYEARSRRPRPSKDEKVIASWNGLMVRAFAEAARVLRSEAYGTVAVEAGRFLTRQLVRNGRVTRSMLGGSGSGPGMLEDHAALGLAFLDLHALTFDRDWLARSRELAERTIDLFHDASGCWFDTAKDHEPLLIRPREATDNALPSGTSMAAELMLRWADLDDRGEFRRLANETVARFSSGLAQYPLAFGHLGGVADAVVHGALQVALVGLPEDPAFGRLAGALAGHYVPGLVLAGGPDDVPDVPALLRGRGLIAGAPGAYVCHGFRCDLPTSDPAELEAKL